MIKNKQTYGLNVTLFVLGCLISFSPALLRWISIGEFLSTTSRSDEISTTVLCVAGAILVALSLFLMYTNKSKLLAYSIAGLGLVVTYFASNYTNLFSLFAF